MQGDARHGDESGDAERCAQGEGELLRERQVEARVAPGEDSEHHEPGHDQDRVPDGRDRRDDEPALGVQDSDRDGADGVEQHLRHEEPQQERGQALLLGGDRRVVDATGEEACQARCGDDADDRHHAQNDQCNSKHAAGEAFGFRLVGTSEQVHERGHEHGRERARGQQLEQHVRDIVRRRERVAQVRRPENCRDRQDAGETDYARRPGGHPHARGRSRDRPRSGYWFDHSGALFAAPVPYPYCPTTLRFRSASASTELTWPSTRSTSSTVETACFRLSFSRIGVSIAPRFGPPSFSSNTSPTTRRRRLATSALLSGARTSLRVICPLVPSTRSTRTSSPVNDAAEKLSPWSPTGSKLMYPPSASAVRRSRPFAAAPPPVATRLASAFHASSRVALAF